MHKITKNTKNIWAKRRTEQNEKPEKIPFYTIDLFRQLEEKIKKPLSETEKAGLALAVHSNVPNGDGGISIGQNVSAGHRLSS